METVESVFRFIREGCKTKGAIILADCPYKSALICWRRVPLFLVMLFSDRAAEMSVLIGLGGGTHSLTQSHSYTKRERRHCSLWLTIWLNGLGFFFSPFYAHLHARSFMLPELLAGNGKKSHFRCRVMLIK